MRLEVRRLEKVFLLLLWQLGGRARVLLVELYSLLTHISVQNVVVFLLYMLDVVLQNISTTPANQRRTTILHCEILRPALFTTVFSNLFTLKVLIII
jgi:hypothetical protein